MAENQISKIADWDQLYTAYKRFKSCDDGSISEGFSDSIAGLLVSQWKGLEAKADLINSDSGYREFILRHIDMLLTNEQFNDIRKNSSLCSARIKAFCLQVNRRLDQVEVESNEEKNRKSE